MLHQLVAILSFPLFVISVSHLNIKKCCTITSQLTAEMTCATDEINEIDDLFWVPTHTIVNKSSLQTLKDNEINEVESWLRRNPLSYGLPECLPFHEANESFYKDEFDEEFRIVLGESERETGVFIGTNFSIIRDIKDDTLEPWLLPLSDVCLDVTFDPDTDDYIYVTKHCPTNSTPWIRKCCPIQHIYNVTSSSCERVPDLIEIMDWRPQASDLGRFYVTADSKPNCTYKTLLQSTARNWRCRGLIDELMQIAYLPNGTIQINNNATYEPHEYCGESTWHEGNQILHDNYIICGKNHLKTAKTITYGILFFIGGICLLITVGLSLWLPELRATMYNKMALTHNATLMFAYFAWGVSEIVPRLEIIECTVLSLIIQFTFLGSFVWLNAMCIDMTSTFRATRLASRGSWKRYFVYSAYAWSLTTIISIITATMEFVEAPPWGIPRPGISCYCGFARHNISILLYFYGPMTVALLLNLVLYIFTTWKIIKLSRTAKILKNSNVAGGSGPQNDTQRLIVYTKLFVLMGLTWMTAVIGWGVNGDNAFWFIMDIVNLLRAIFIFILFICKRPILRSIKLRVKALIWGEDENEVVTMETVVMSVSRKTANDLQAAMELKNRDERVLAQKRFTMGFKKRADT